LFGDTNAPAQQIEIRLRNKNGSWNTFEAVASNLVYDNVAEAAMVNLRDITERKQMEEALRERDIKFKHLLSWVPGIVYQFTMRPDGTYCMPFTSEAIRDFYGCSPEDVRDDFSPINRAILPQDLDKYLGSIEYSIKHITNWKCEYRVQIPGQSIRWMLGNAKPEKLDDGSITWYGFNTDITERKRAEAQLQESERRYRKLSIIDDLTQLYNSRHFYAQLEIEIERSNRYGQPLTLLLLDLDNFKTFNDKYGHVEGDYVLSQLGQVIKRCLRETDSAYRYGGEEFTIMLPMTTSKEGIVTAKRIQMELRKEAFSPVLGQEVYMTVSIGLAQYKPKEEMKKFVQRVDQLMYQAKKDGRDRICPES
jgi:diguanylate cyclase (GGDEF)-like protein